MCQCRIWCPSLPFTGMKIVFSRKGFDSAAGGAPSPIIRGRPTSIPIPARDRSETTYRDLGLGAIVEQITRGRVTEATLCHADPMFERCRCAFGQTGAAQTHLANNGVGVGDVFLFFGLFSEPDRADPHHPHLRLSQGHGSDEAGIRAHAFESAARLLTASSTHHRVMERQQHNLRGAGQNRRIGYARPASFRPRRPGEPLGGPILAPRRWADLPRRPREMGPPTARFARWRAVRNSSPISPDPRRQRHGCGTFWP